MKAVRVLSIAALLLAAAVGAAGCTLAGAAAGRPRAR
jgi:hypothetical protein